MKKIVPFGDRILCRRRKVGETVGKAGIIIAPSATAEQPTDIADVVYVPENTFADEELISQADSIIKALTENAKHGDSEALVALMKYNQFLQIKSVKVGDCIMLGKYVGIDFHDNQGGGNLTLCQSEDVIAKVENE